MKQSRLHTGLVAVALLPALAGCSGFSDWFHARDNMNNGVRAFSATNYASAAEYFQAALEYDPDVPNGELYLGLSYFQQFIPGLETPENQRFADQAIEVLEGILETEPLNPTAIAALASIYQNRLELERAREYYVLQTEARPDDPVAYYGIGSLNWIILNTPDAEEMSVEEKAALIEEAQEYLDKALELDPLYENAAIYKNLQYREASYLIPEDTEDEELIARREELEALADEWYDRAMAMRGANAESAAQGAAVE
jgi:tetratricopeptide (TPR) repeat protein